MVLRATATALVVLEATGVSALFGIFLDEHAGLAVMALAGGLCVAALVWWLSGRMKRRWVLPSIVIAAAVLTPASAIWPGGITYAGFGLTVVGGCPIPALDVTMDGDGRLGFREKTHRIRLEEVAAIHDPAVEVVVIGTGWHGVAEVDYDLQAISYIEILRTGEAVERYRELRRAGKRVVLLLHTTC